MYLYYLINTIDNNIYIGITNNLERRIKEHNTNKSHYTGKIKGEWKVLKYRYFEKEAEARKEEKRLKKSKNRKYIEWYFQQSP